MMAAAKGQEKPVKLNVHCSPLVREKPPAFLLQLKSPCMISSIWS